MSTTPRTDDVLFCAPLNHSHEEFWVKADFARQLETQLAVLEADFEKLALSSAQAADRNVELRSRAERAEADTERLDWLDENMCYNGGGSGGTYTFFTPADVERGMLRDAIDAAMKEGNK